MRRFCCSLGVFGDDSWFDLDEVVAIESDTIVDEDDDLVDTIYVYLRSGEKLRFYEAVSQNNNVRTDIIAKNLAGLLGKRFYPKVCGGNDTLVLVDIDEEDNALRKCPLSDTIVVE